MFRIAVRRGSFAPTANETGTSAAYVNKRIAILEKRLHVNLFHRTTRRVTITEEGETIYGWAQKLGDDVEQMMEDIAGAKSGPRKWINKRVSPLARIADSPRNTSDWLFIADCTHPACGPKADAQRRGR